MRHSRVFILCICCVAGSFSAVADEPLRSLVDQRLAAVSGIQSAKCSDAEFLRRVSLDLTGMPPTADAARAFLSDAAPDKRERLVNGLLDSPHYARHMASTLDLMLMERRANTNVSADEWQAWLFKSMSENKPWNILAREILLADGDDPNLRPAARFALDRGAEPNLLTHDTSRIFFGRDLQCAQCHDHPLVSDYLQSDYQGLLAFVSPGYALVRKEGDKQVTLFAERAGSDLSFESVFAKGTMHRTGPRIPDDVAIDEPSRLPGDEYDVAPADNVKSVPKFSRRAKLAELATNGGNAAFNANIANRLWAHMFGRGLVHPLDLHHPDNPATDPELLQILSSRFAAMNFNIRDFLKELALTDAYQRSFDVPADLVPGSAVLAGRIPELQSQRPAVETAAKDASQAYVAATDAWHAAETALLPVVAELDAARNAYAEAKKKADEVRKAISDATLQKQTKETAAASLEQAAAAIRTASAALPDDKQLAESVERLNARRQQLMAEAAAQGPVIDEKTVALKPLADAQEAAKQPIAVVESRAAPLRVGLREAERAMLAARRRSSDASQSLGALDSRLKAAGVLAELPKAQAALSDAAIKLRDTEGQLTAVQRRVSEYGPVVAQAEANLRAASEAMTTASGNVNMVTADHNRRTEFSAAIATALQATQSAQQKLPEDASLAEVVTRLKDRIAVAEAAVGESQSLLNAATASMSSAAEAVALAQKNMTEVGAENVRRNQELQETSRTLETATASLQTRQSEMTSRITEAEDRLVRNFASAPLKPLTPEQLCWSVFRVTGVYDRYWQAEVSELDKTSPLTDEQKMDAAVVAARQRELEQRTFDKLKGNVSTFVAFYGAAAGQPQGDFFSTADQALFVANGSSINSWVVPSADNVTDRIVRQADSRLAAEELYLAILTRMPTDEEIAEVTRVLNSRTADRNVAAQELVWAALNSAEFRFNH